MFVHPLRVSIALIIWRGLYLQLEQQALERLVRGWQIAKAQV